MDNVDKKNLPEVLKVLVMSPDKTLFQGEAITVSCRNPVGEFDILPEHSFFMSMIDTHIDIQTPDHHKTSIHINQAILQVSHDQVIILIDVQEKEAKSMIHNLLRPDEIMQPDKQTSKPLEKKKNI
ncbi:MAG: hypothetical protein O3B87_00895 [bacterium]|nr:hypothetical protein [bacterium]